MLDIYIDADACPVKQEVFRVAERCGLSVTLVANSWMRTPQNSWIKLVVVNDHLDAADDWIAEHAGENDIVVTGDIPLAFRSLKKGALALGTKGVEFTEDNVVGALAARDILAEMRESGTITGGPAQFEKKDRSRFLQSLDQMIRRVRQKNADA